MTGNLSEFGLRLGKTLSGGDGPDGERRKLQIRGILIMVLTLCGIELAGMAGIPVPAPAPIYFLAIVYAAYIGGVSTGLISTGIALAYTVYFWFAPHHSPAPPTMVLQRFLILAITAPMIAVFVGMLKARSDRLAATLRQLQEGPLQQHVEQLSRDLSIATNAQQLAAEAVMILDQDFRISSVNRAFTEMCGYSEAEVVGRKATFLRVAGDPQEESDKSLEQPDASKWDIVAKTGRWTGVTRRRRKDGSMYIEHSSISVIRSANGRITHYVVVTLDITRIREHEKRLAFLAYHDDITRLPNRVLFSESLNRTLSSAARCKSQFSVMVIELDRIKTFNQSLSHTISETVLKAVVERIRGQLELGEGDLIAALRTEQFVLLINRAMSANAMTQFAAALQGALDNPFSVAGQEMFVTAHFGAATYPGDGNHPDLLINNATLAMQEARKRPGLRFLAFSPQLEDDNATTVALTNDLHRAIERRELTLAYQPKIDARSGCISGAEALLRWNHATIGHISPVRFIPLAEESGTIVAIGDWVLASACRQAAIWRNAGQPDFRIAVNLSARQLRQSDFVSRVRTILKETGLPASALELEITESLLMDDPVNAVGILQQLHDAGISLAIDDFGTGYSSLAYLKTFPIDCLKIDRAFIKDLPGDQGDVAITKAVIAMARSLQLQVVAEGVETTAQRDILLQEGCDTFQGFLFSQPLTAVEMEQYVIDASNTKAID